MRKVAMMKALGSINEPCNNFLVPLGRTTTAQVTFASRLPNICCGSVECRKHSKTTTSRREDQLTDSCTNSTQLDEALKIFVRRPIYDPEACRAHYKRSLVFEAQDRHEEASEARIASARIYDRLKQQGMRLLEPRAVIGHENVDEIVCFWSR